MKIVQITFAKTSCQFQAHIAPVPALYSEKRHTGTYYSPAQGGLLRCKIIFDIAWFLHRWKQMLWDPIFSAVIFNGPTSTQ